MLSFSHYHAITKKKKKLGDLGELNPRQTPGKQPEQQPGTIAPRKTACVPPFSLESSTTPARNQCKPSIGLEEFTKRKRSPSPSAFSSVNIFAGVEIDLLPAHNHEGKKGKIGGPGQIEPLPNSWQTARAAARCNYATEDRVCPSIFVWRRQPLQLVTRANQA